jgi:hypothetical protein
MVGAVVGACLIAVHRATECVLPRIDLRWREYRRGTRRWLRRPARSAGRWRRSTLHSQSVNPKTVTSETPRAHRDQLVAFRTMALHRRCERRTTTRKAAECLFFTLGGAQVGAGAIAGWRDVIQPVVSEVKLGEAGVDQFHRTRSQSSSTQALLAPSLGAPVTMSTASQGCRKTNSRCVEPHDVTCGPSSRDALPSPQWKRCGTDANAHEFATGPIDQQRGFRCVPDPHRPENSGRSNVKFLRRSRVHLTFRILPSFIVTSAAQLS